MSLFAVPAAVNMPKVIAVCDVFLLVIGYRHGRGTRKGIELSLIQVFQSISENNRTDMVDELSHTIYRTKRTDRWSAFSIPAILTTL